MLNGSRWKKLLPLISGWRIKPAHGEAIIPHTGKLSPTAIFKQKITEASMLLLKQSSAS